MSSKFRTLKDFTAVNQTIAGTQSGGDVAPTKLNTYYTAWIDGSNYNGARGSVVARHFDNNGNALAGEVLITPLNNASLVPFNITELDAVNRSLAGGNDGLAISFTDDLNLGGNLDLYVVRTNAALGRLEDPILVDGGGLVTNHSSITALASGRLAVAYTVQNSATDWDINLRFIEANGTLGALVPLFDQTDRSDNVELATLTNGNIVAVYQSELLGDSNNNDVFFSIVTSGGSVVAGPTAAIGGLDSANELNASVTALARGGFVVTWEDSAGDGAGYGVRASIYNSAGTLVRSNILVNTVEAGDQRQADVSALPDGGFVVTWSDFGVNQVFNQRFDANGDRLGTPDLVVNNGTFGGASIETLTDGSIVETVSSTDIFSATHSEDSVRSDFNNDFGSDMLWSSAQGVLGVWTIANGTIFSTTALNHDMPGWQALGGDFTGDGTADLLWRNASGVLGVWEMQNGAIFDSIALNHDMPGWTPLAGDFNGDGTDDLLWNSGAQGVLGVWEMQNGAISDSIALEHDMPGWSALVGDFNGDGTDDLLWNSGAQGVLGVWEMRDSLIFNSNALNHDMPGWNAVVGDFNGDGTDDLLWNSGAQGVLGVWEMRDGEIGRTIALNHDMPGWRVIGTGDYNRDGTTDLLWSNANGVLGVWMMQDNQIAQTVAVNHDMPGWTIIQ